jgi:hypothetical protein
MVTEATEKFGKRLCTLMDLADITSEQLASFLGRTIQQIEVNYMTGKQMPPGGSGMYKLYVLFEPVTMGMIYGIEPLDPSLVDKQKIHARIKDYT